MSEKAGLTSKPKFGEWLRGIYASESNPQRDGMYVRTIRRTGRMNPGTFYELTDGKGRFWQYLAQSVESVAAPQPPAEAQPCGCGEATCTVPWEPGCGLGKSEQHAEALQAENETLRDALDYLRQMQGVPDALELRAKAARADGGFTAADMMDARQEGRKEAEARAERMAKALDTIARVGKASRNQTTRTRWIVARAISALNGDNDWQALPKPKGFHDALLRDQEAGRD